MVRPLSYDLAQLRPLELPVLECVCGPLASFSIPRVAVVANVDSNFEQRICHNTIRPEIVPEQLGCEQSFPTIMINISVSLGRGPGGTLRYVSANDQQRSPTRLPMRSSTRVW